jgi:hypothetical protein
MRLHFICVISRVIPNRIPWNTIEEGLVDSKKIEKTTGNLLSGLMGGLY